MAVSAPALHDGLVQIVGGEHIQTDPSVLARHAVDDVIPRWVACPARASQVSGLMALAHAEGLAVSPRGSGSSLALGNRPRRLDLVIDLTRLSSVLDYVPEDLVATVEAGRSLEALNGELAGHGQMLALDPIAGAARTIGGIVATSASGPLRFRYGTARDVLLGLRFVEADGTLTWGGSKVVKSVTGYDVPKLFVGSLGTLGIIVEATLRLHPLPAMRGSWRFAFASPEASSNFVAALLDSSLEPDRVTLMNGEAGRGAGCDGRGPVALVSIGSVEEAVESQEAALTRLGGDCGARSEAMPSSIWETLGAALDAPVGLRLSCEPRRVIAWLLELERCASRLDVRASVVAQPGSGVLHAALHGPLSDGATLDRAVLAPLRERLLDEGGSLVVEHAPPELKRSLDVWGPIPAPTLAIMSSLKRAFDPADSLNPGRFVGGL